MCQHASRDTRAARACGIEGAIANEDLAGGQAVHDPAQVRSEVREDEVRGALPVANVQAVETAVQRFFGRSHLIQIPVVVLRVVEGGATRADSVRLALAEVPPEALVVLVHDAARPLVGDAVIERLLTRLGEGVDGVVPALPIGDTVKRVEHGLVLETVDRDALVAVQTPQAFLADRLRAAFSGDLAGATDCASLVERGGGTVAVVPGDPRLVKVTTSDDLVLVSRLLDER